MNLYVSVAIVCVVVVVAMLWMLLTRRIREKYAAIWIVLTLAVVVLGVFPELAFWLSDLLGVQTPVNLVFAVALVVLAAVCLQLSTEVSTLEEETRTLAEEVALLRADTERALAGVGATNDPQATGTASTPGEPTGPDEQPGPDTDTTDTTDTTDSVGSAEAADAEGGPA